MLTHQSIARKLQLGVGVATALVLGLTLWFNYRTGRAELEQETDSKAMSQIRATARQLDDFIARVGMLPRSTASRQQAVGREPDPGMVPLMAQLLGQMPVDEAYGLAMAFEDKDWRAADAMPWVDRRSWPNKVTLGYDYHDPKWEWYVGPKTSGRFYVTEPYFDEGGSEITMVTLSVPMFDANSRFFGVATVDLALGRLREMVRAARLRGAAESGRSGTDEFAYLVSRSGKIIVHLNEELMLRKGFPGADVKTRPGGQAVAASPEGITQAMMDGARRRVYWATSPLTGWKVVLNIEEDAIFAPVRALTMRSVLIGVAGLLGMMLVVTFIARRLGHPLLNLARTATAIERGNFHEELLGQLPHRRDELGGLARSFQQMAREIQTRERSLAELNQNLEKTVRERTAELTTRATELRQRTDELQHTNFLSDSALDLTKAGYWHVPLDGSGWYNSSERAARIFGDPPTSDHRYSLDHWAEHVRAGDEAAAKTTMENFTAAVAGDIPVYDATYAYKRPIDGRVVWIHALGHVVKSASGKPTDMFGVTQDITEFKKLEAELRAAMAKTEEATKAKSAFLANMSHEIRTPMNGIMGMTELALDTELTGEQRDYLSTVKSSAEALLSLLNDILDFSKIEAGRIELDPIEFLLRDSISDTLNPLALRASSKGLELAYDVQPDVPDALIGDVYRLRQVMVNLVGNAIKFTERGEVVVSVKLAERTGDDVALRVEVRDTGIGIKPEAAAKLFKPFEQAEASTTRKYGGTGLGLAISRQLVELMGGQISLHSEAGAGSTFGFTVKLKVGTARASAVADDAARLFQDKTVLVVDDNETNRRILTTMMGHWGLRTIAADSANAALAMLDRARSAGQPICLMVTDLHMPDIDGFQLTEMVRARPAHANLPIFLLTSSGSPGDTARCTELRVAARLLKPVKQSLLLDNIVRVLAGVGRIDAAPAPAPSESATTPAAQRPLRVLLAEDNAVNQKFALRVLSGAGHQVTLANNGREAVNQSAANAFDVILMDVQMPELDGLDATREIRARESASGRRTPIIAMTANAMKGDREMCEQAGMDGYVPKPVKREILFAEIDRILKGGGDGADVRRD